MKRNPQAKISPSDQKNSKELKKLIDFKKKNTWNQTCSYHNTFMTEHSSYEYHFESKYQANSVPSNQISEQLEEKLIDFKGKQKMEPNKFSSDHIQNEVLTFTSEI